VRYSPQVARWLAERFPGARRLEDGAVEVTHRVVEPSWLVRMVLQYGAEAEVVGPASYREYVSRAVGAS
jgi:predicted DNA-binding transcriptional regulator YafY